VPYLFTYAGAPWLSQQWSRFIMDNAYGSGVKGICGNEDVGQMSAWYILSAIGFHPVSPVDGVYIIGSPLFDEVNIRLDPQYYKGREFTVLARHNSAQNLYIQSAKLNGKTLARAWITHAEIVQGGTLEFIMGSTPNKEWGANLQARKLRFQTNEYRSAKRLTRDRLLGGSFGFCRPTRHAGGGESKITIRLLAGVAAAG
jgi:putative alpha-1,2-mannosidase